MKSKSEIRRKLGEEAEKANLEDSIKDEVLETKEEGVSPVPPVSRRVEVSMSSLEGSREGELTRSP